MAEPLNVELFVAAYQLFIEECHLTVRRKVVQQNRAILQGISDALDERPDVVYFNMMLELLEASADGEPVQWSVKTPAVQK